MSSYSYISISIVILFILIIVAFWKIKENVPHYQISVNNDVFFKDEHIDFERDILKDLDNPWDFPIEYCVEDPVNKENVDKAIKELQNNTCVTFKKKGSCKNTTKELIFKKADFCSSYVGHAYKRYSQIIYLSPDCYKNPYIILHEIGHALGLVHEHSRKDRNEYVTIDYDSLDKNEKKNFEIQIDSFYFNYSTTYDYSALMHYAPYDFATTLRWFFGFPVIKPKLRREYSRMMGQRKKMTFNEYKRINLCYCNRCGWVNNSTGERNTSHETKCENGGYPNYKNCSRCVCPTGYEGKKCKQIVKNESNCGNTNYTVNATLSSFKIHGKKKCHILLQSKENTRIQLLITHAYAPYEDAICTEDVGFQFKYMKDKGTTGLLLCGSYIYNILLESESNSILVFYNGIDNHSLLAVNFQQIS